MEDWRNGGFGVYVHWPFCAAKCPYCDFNSHVRQGVEEAVWRDGLIRAIRQQAERVPGRTVDTIFFGGGTPSLMDPMTVATVIDTIASVWTVAPDAEITLEANPTSVEAGRFRGYHDAGVNRLSMGIQALNDADLRALGRMHDVAAAEQAYAIARAIFPRVSFDLIYARQGQTLEGWRAELERAIAMAVDHLSLYQLTIEAGTRFGDLAARGRLRNLPTPELAADMFLLTNEICGMAGMAAYETSNHARPTAESRHNLVYWRYGDYAGIGPGAHGRLSIGGQRIATSAIRGPEAWLADITAGGTGMVAESTISPTEQAVEMAMMGLRLRGGIDLDRYQTLAGEPMSAEAIEELRTFGLVQLTGQRLAVTSEGGPLLDAILRRLLT